MRLFTIFALIPCLVASTDLRAQENPFPQKEVGDVNAFMKSLGVDTQSTRAQALLKDPPKARLESVLEILPSSYWEQPALEKSSDSLQSSDIKKQKGEPTVELPRAMGFRFERDKEDRIQRAVSIAFNHPGFDDKKNAGSDELEIMIKDRGGDWRFYTLLGEPLRVVENRAEGSQKTCISCHGSYDPETRKLTPVALPLLNSSDWTTAEAKRFCDFAKNDPRYKVIDCESFMANVNEPKRSEDRMNPFKGGILSKTPRNLSINVSLVELDREQWEKRLKGLKEFYPTTAVLPEEGRSTAPGKKH